MFSSSARRRLLAMVIIPFLGVLLALPGSAAAATPIQDRETFVHDFAFDDCGPHVEGHTEGSFEDTLWVGDALDANGLPVILKHLHREQGAGTWSANGKSLAFSFSDAISDFDVVYNGPQVVTLPDGTTRTGASYSFHTLVNGVRIKIKLPNGGVISADAGSLELSQTLVLFPDGNGWSIASEVVAIHGLHPLEGTGPCEIIQQYLG